MPEAKRNIIPPYSETQTKKWLSWIAKNMQKHDQTIFLIENLQPSWLKKRSQRKIHWVGSLITAGLFWGLLHLIIQCILIVLTITLGQLIDPLSGIYDLATIILQIKWSFVDGFTFGMLSGLATLLSRKKNVIALTDFSGSWRLKNIRKNYWLKIIKGMIGGLIFGLGYGIFFIVSSYLFLDKNLPEIDIRDNLMLILFSAIFFGLFFGIIGLISSGWNTENHRSSTMPNEKIKDFTKISLKFILIYFLLSLFGTIFFFKAY